MTPNRSNAPTHRNWPRLLLFFGLIAGTLAGCGGPPPAHLPEVDPSVAADFPLEAAIGTELDDGEEAADGHVSLYSSDLELVYDTSSQVVGIRFIDLDIPAGSSIVQAYVQFVVDETSSEATSIEIRAQVANDAPPFAPTNGNLSARPRTTAAVVWQPPAWTRVRDAGPDQRTPDLSAVLQEVVGRPGWQPGNAIALIFTGTGTGRRVAKAFKAAAPYPAVLHLVYRVDRSVQIDSFGHAPDPVAPENSLTFDWSVSDSDGDPVSCTLDVDSDGTPEYSIGDCLATTSRNHTYSGPGAYTATLTATDSTGVRATATSVVTVSLGAEIVVEVAVIESADDAEEQPDGRVSRSSPDLELVEDTATQLVGIRFDGVDVPSGAAILRAYVQFQVDERSTVATTLTIQGQASDSVANFASNFSISSRARTAASAQWQPPAWTVVGERGPDQQTSDLAAIIQEIVDRPGWRRGNALALVVSGSGKRVAEAFDGDPAGAPQLHIEYSFDDTLAIDGFAAAPLMAAVDEPVSFSWSVSDSDGDPVSCTLDVDNDGTPEYSIGDCLATTGIDHAYSGTGVFDARLSASSGFGAQRQATVAVTVGTENSTVIAAAGDIACDPDSDKFNGGQGTDVYCHERAVSDMILALDPALVLPLGDVQYEQGTLDQFLRSYETSWGRFKEISRPAVGNHEYLDPGASGYFQYFGPLAGSENPGFYSFDVDGWHVVALNSNCSKAGGCRAGSPQERWLRADLAANPSRCLLAYWHHPRFSSGAIGGRDWTIDLWRALQDAGGDVVLVGHDHNYERFAPQDADGNADPNGIREFVVGTGGKNHTSIYTIEPNSEVRRSGTYGFLKLTLHPAGYDWEFVAEPGSSFTDTGSATCN